MQAFVTDLIEKLNAEVARMRADGKLSWSEILQLVYAGVTDCFVIAAKLANLTVADRKAAVKEAILAIYDQVLAPINITGIPIVEGIVDAQLRRIVEVGADALVAYVMSTFQSKLAAMGDA